MLGAEVTAQLPQFAVDLRAVWKRQVGNSIVEQIQTSYLIAQRDASLDIE